VRANSIVIGFHKASVNQQTIAASDLPHARGNYSDDRRPMRRTAVVDQTHFLSPVIEVFGIV
jgi:hypothetical protein